MHMNHTMPAISEHHPLIVIFPDGKMIVQTQGCADVRYDVSVDRYWQPISLDMNGAYMVFPHGGPRKWLRYKEQERRRRLKEKKHAKQG